MVHVSEEQVRRILTFDKLIPALHLAFGNDSTVPQRHHHSYGIKGQEKSTLLLMPAWDNRKYLGIKIVNVNPANANKGISSIHGQYLLHDIESGVLLAMLSARNLTSIRTAATSALVSSLVSRQNSNVMMMVGTGALAPYLIQAHCAIRPIEKVLVWGRDHRKAERLCHQLSGNSNIRYEPVKDIIRGMQDADIVSTATYASDPLIPGSFARPGQHFDLVGSYLPDMREADDDLIRKSKVFVDTVEGAATESGDLAIPIANGVIDKSDIVSDLFGLCRIQRQWRSSDDDITCFKSVGHALEDLTSAALVYETLSSMNA